MALACWPNGDVNRNLLGQANAYGPCSCTKIWSAWMVKSSWCICYLSYISPTSKVGAKPFRPSLLAGEAYERCACAFTVMSCAQATPWLQAPTEKAVIMLASKNTKVFEASAMEEVTAAELFMLEQVDTLDNGIQILEPKAPRQKQTMELASKLFAGLPLHAISTSTLARCQDGSVLAGDVALFAGEEGK